MTKPRDIAAVALAAGTFGGAIGASATIAVQAQASAHATAAAQSVSDPYAQRLLRLIYTYSYDAAANDHQICVNTRRSIVGICQGVRP